MPPDVPPDMEADGLTMRLLALVQYCEGPKAAEIRHVMSKLPLAAYRERGTAEKELAKLKQENDDLKQKLANLSAPAGRDPRNRFQGDQALHDLRALPQQNPLGVPNMQHSQPLQSRPAQTLPLSIPNAQLPGGPQSAHRNTSPTSSDLFPDRAAKRLRIDSPQGATLRRPACTGCFQNNLVCDGRVVCSACRDRRYGCEYRSCRDGATCADGTCSRLHPGQWDEQAEPDRKIKRFT
ncbi:unnamed protein product [Zymoseptoria tritici ST99CH_3D1]|nr:unnamed protein product [Zymoseptoria tritici ST99CH_3D1]